MVHNLFVVNTPLQLLTAYIVANTEFNGEDNHLLFINRNHRRLRQSSYYVNKMLSDTSTWSQSDVIERWLDRSTRVTEIRQEMKRMRALIMDHRSRIDNVFLGSDKSIPNQVVVELSGNTKYYRIEDGVWSYACPDRSTLSKIWHTMRVHWFRRLGGLHSNMVYNVGGLGYGKAAIGDYLYKPDLLQRYSPSVIQITRHAVHQAMDKLVDCNDDGYQGLAPDSVLFLGSLQVEYGEVTRERELSILKQVYRECLGRGLKLIYKPHPAESQAKLMEYEKMLPGLEFIELRDPMEVLYARFDGIKCTMAHSSSALLFADVFSKTNIKAIALYNVYNSSKENQVLNRLMVKAGVIIPRTMEELSKYLRQINSTSIRR